MEDELPKGIAVLYRGSDVRWDMMGPDMSRLIVVKSLLQAGQPSRLVVGLGI
jgi:hypothetical protein